MLLRTAFLLICFFSLVAFAPRPEPTAGYRPADDYQLFVERARALAETGEAFRAKTAGADELRNSVTAARMAYKRVAWLVEYDHPGFAAKHFNGAPLLKAKRSGTRAEVVLPEGLQVLDEGAFAEAPDAASLAIVSKALLVSSRQLLPEVATRTYDLPELLAAARAATIALPTLGLTGFDTPGSVNALAEAKVVLKAIGDALESAGTSTSHGTRVRAHLNEGLEMLSQNDDFDTFDRLRFVREVTEPLLASLTGWAETLPPAAPSGNLTAIRPSARSMFNDGFLNPYAFTEMTAEEDSDALRRLGRRLFYDATLSADSKLSCASCHQPELAFTDGQPKSLSSRAGETLQRNAPTLINAVYADRFFYDLRAFTLEQQAEHVIFEGAEFGTAYAEILRKINGEKDYRKLVREALGTKVIDRDGFSSALASYVLSLRSFNSPFDRYIRGETADFPAAAKRGFNLFMGKAACGTCHFAPTFSGLVPPAYLENETEILGVLSSPHRLRKELDPDQGRSAGGIHHDGVWIYDRSFKTPTVRNAALTAPYFHNGAYKTLELVVGFYDHGGGQGIGLDVPNQTLPPDSLLLSHQEKADLVAFMESLSDPILPSR
ncbi:cytochrome-c peroxidase [Neolewinella aurantiaca]|uniref:Cytochrome-c peroxidase n=1 Tax=Neolewinella aurantiaca TaxID=2602767 RepID=A0A5C7FAG1_9BACT|nr:cytochrome c peroxidase [Neolewinella aurantiaca]TXF87790.1 cytochrome-c peroxidase [Neolewinella aurantiaca]